MITRVRFMFPRLVIVFAALLLGIALPVVAQSDEKPPALEPLPELPPPPVGTETEPALEPQVTILKRGEDTVEEYRINGRLYMIKVIPRHGVPYYLVDSSGDGVFHRHDGIANDVLPPMWVIFTF